MRSQPIIVMRFWVIRLAILMAIGIVADSIQAQPKAGDAAMQQVLRKAQGVIRQLTEEKAALEKQKLELENQKAGLEAEKSSLIAEKTALLNAKTSLEAKVKKLETSIKPLEPLPAELNRCKLGNQALQHTKTTLETRLSNVMGKLRQIESNNTLLLDAVKERERWITVCGKKNQELVTSAHELVGKYKDKSIWEEVGDAEPFTGIGKVNTENSAEEYRYKIEHLKATTFESETQFNKEPAQSEEVVAPSSVGGSGGHAP